MQPAFLPWAGYFRLIASVDEFVFLDDVQLTRQSWQTRNRILISGDTRWITLPIRHGGLDRTIAETAVDKNPHWRKKLAKRLQHEYQNHPYANDLQGLIQDFESLSVSSVADFDIGLIKYCLEKLGIEIKFSLSSELCPKEGAELRTDRIIRICRMLGCTHYLSPRGAATYLADDGFEQQAEVVLEFSDWMPPKYPQRGSVKFISHLSIVDVIANLGWSGARQYILSDGLESQT